MVPKRVKDNILQYKLSKKENKKKHSSKVSNKLKNCAFAIHFFFFIEVTRVFSQCPVNNIII